MNTVNLNLPKGTIVKGQLCVDYDVESLDQDILEITLPSGVTIDVGWIPEYDPNGQFRIVVYRDYWRNQLTAPEFVAGVPDLCASVERLAELYTGSGAVSSG